ncbi:MAG: 3-phosphoshikimate 1-carboxyvinyltransferase [Alphaproteobacteria bacterium]|nr:3-phosphoshikimate 1-carboxyvinyltransferase [Alphaproteobacteria bacterium]
MATATNPLRGPLFAAPSAVPLTGRVRVPGDKSISHRALMLGGLAIGETRVTGLLEGEDVLATAAAMRMLGAEVERLTDGSWRVHGTGVGGLAEPDNVLDMGNAGTGARLLMGLLASHPLTAFLTGDASLRRRPMARVTTPLALCGARFVGREGGRLPLAVVGAREPVAIDYRLPVASAQVKSAILLAGLNAAGTTRVIEPEATRDHTERMMRHFGASVTRGEEKSEGVIELAGEAVLRGADVLVPADPSSAAFPMAAALLVPGSDVTCTDLCLNPGRIGLIETLREMGADLTIENAREQNGEPVGDVRVRHGRLKGVTVPAERAPSMIDEYPVLAAIAAVAEGKTHMPGIGELRVKESDRLDAVARGLEACGVRVSADADSLTVAGGEAVRGNGRSGTAIRTDLDHRIAMAFAVLGLAARDGVRVDDAAPIATSFPDFVPLMQRLGADLRVGGESGRETGA